MDIWLQWRGDAGGSEGRPESGLTILSAVPRQTTKASSTGATGSARVPRSWPRCSARNSASAPRPFLRWCRRGGSKWRFRCPWIVARKPATEW